MEKCLSCRKGDAMLDLNYEPEVVVEDITALTYEEWKRHRTQGIGGSDAAAVCGISPWTTARDLYEEKVYKKITEENDENWVAKEIGRLLEELVVQIYMKRENTNPYAVRKMFRHPLYPFMIADCDYFVMIDGKIFIIECKTSFSYQINGWEDGNIPPHYTLQGRHYMSVANVDGVIFLCLHGNNENSLIIRRLERDLVQEEALIKQEAYFWEKNVLSKKPPKYTEKADLVLKSIQRRYGIQEGKKIILPASYEANISEYLKLRKQKSALSLQLKQIEEQMKLAYAPIQEAMEGAETAILETGGSRYQVGYTRKVSTSIYKDSLEVLQMMHPDIYKEYARTNVSYSFYIKDKKAG